MYYAFSPKFPFISAQICSIHFFLLLLSGTNALKTDYYAPAEAPCPYAVYYFAFPYLLSGSVQMDEPDVYNVCLSDFIIGLGSFSCAHAHAILSQFPCFPTYIFGFHFPLYFFGHKFSPLHTAV
jgi:hypothetical protein